MIRAMSVRAAFLRPFYRDSVMRKVLLSALLLCAAQPVLAVERLDVLKNDTTIEAPANPQAIDPIPPGFHFVEPGYLTVATANTNSPPLGLLADSLGLKLRLVPAAWEDWQPGVTAGRYDVAMFNIAVTEERKKKFDFATYRADGHAFLVEANSPISAINKAEDVAGKRIVVGSGTNQERIRLGWDEKNRAKGLKQVTPVYLTDEAAATLTLLSGRADALFGPQSMAA